jgi:chemotaxis methyl-accepting protein methylase
MTEALAFNVHCTRLGDSRIATWNDFFRPENSSGLRLARWAAPAYLDLQPDGTTYNVADVGCSQGMDTWSLAAAFVVHNVRAQITGMDVNPEVLARADRPYRQTRQQLHEKIARWGLPPATLDLFERVDSQHIQPTAELRDTVAFRPVDIRTEPLEPVYDAVVANNVLSYYAEGTKPQLSRIVGNIVCGLKPEGFVMVGTYFPTFQPEFEEHGLVPALHLCGKPSGPTFFELRQPAASSALPS